MLKNQSILECCSRQGSQEKKWRGTFFLGQWQGTFFFWSKTRYINLGDFGRASCEIHGLSPTGLVSWARFLISAQEIGPKHGLYPRRRLFQFQAHFDSEEREWGVTKESEIGSEAAQALFKQQAAIYSFFNALFTSQFTLFAFSATSSSILNYSLLLILSASFAQFYQPPWRRIRSPPEHHTPCATSVLNCLRDWYHFHFLFRAFNLINNRNCALRFYSYFFVLIDLFMKSS